MDQVDFYLFCPEKKNKNLLIFTHTVDCFITQEVNKIRRAGMMYGFHEMLFSLAQALEKESESMKPEVVVQLRHVAEGLRNSPSRDVTTNILAINTFRRQKSNSGSE